MRYLVALAVILLSACARTAGNGATDAAVAPGAETSATIARPAWSYTAERDKMTDKIYRAADIKSSDNLPDDPPYSAAPLRLSVHETGGMFLSSQGHQFECYGSYGCKISVRIDGGSAREIDATDLSMEPPTLSLYDDKLLADLPKAKTMLVEVPLFRRGGAVVTFDVSGFDPERIKVAQP